MQIKGAQGTNRWGALYCFFVQYFKICKSIFFLSSWGCTLNFIIS